MSTSELNSRESETIPRFIVGMSRAGTTWLGKCLNEHPEVAVFGETSFWGRWYVTPNKDGMYDRAQTETIIRRLKKNGTCVQAFAGDRTTGERASWGGPGNLKTLNRSNVGVFLDRVFPEIPDSIKPVDLFVQLGQAIAESEEATGFIEKTPHHVNWLGRIIREMPQARFILMMREPYAFMLSYKHQGNRKKKYDRWKYQWKNHPLGTAMVWRGYMRSINEARHNWPEQTYLVRFEDIAEGAQGAGGVEEVLLEVQQFLQITPRSGLDKRVPPDNTSFPEGSRPVLRGEDLFWMKLMAGKQIIEAGYSLRSVPFQPLRILFSTLLVPLWFLRQYIHLRRRTGGSWFAYVWNWLKPSQNR